MAEYLARLDNYLDTATLDAALGLMISECRTAIRRQRGLIGLERLGQRDTSRRMDRLEELMTMEAGLQSALDRLRERGDIAAKPEEASQLGATVVKLRHGLG